MEFVPSPQDSVEVSGNHDAKPNETAVAVGGTENPISGTDNDELCGSLQYDDDLTDEVATENDACDVTPYFFETVRAPNRATGNRSVDVSVQGETVVSGFDPLNGSGQDIAVSRAFGNVEVTDGAPTIGTTTQADNSAVGGVATLDPGESPPGRPARADPATSSKMVGRVSGDT